MANYWYSYIGQPQSGLGSAQYYYPSNYRKTSFPDYCEFGDVPCTIYAPAFVGLIPGSFSNKLKSYINAGVASGYAQPAIVNAKIYFYVTIPA